MKSRPEIVNALHDMQYVGNPEIQNAIVTGAYVTLYGYNKKTELDSLIATGDITAQINHLINKFLDAEQEEHEEAIRRAQYVFENLENVGGQDYADALRGIIGVITNCNAITAEGFGCGADGNPAEDKYYNLLPNGPVAEYGTFQYYNKATGASGDDPTIGGEQIRVMMTKTPEGVPLTITATNGPMLAAGAIKAVKANPALIWKLLTSVAIDPNTKKNIGPASIIRGAIVNIAKGMGIAEFAENGELIRNVTCGNIQNYRHLMISAMEELCKCDIEVIKKASEADVERYILWINACILPATQQEQIFSEGDLKSYLDNNGKALRGADTTDNIVSGPSVDIAQNRRYLQLLGKNLVIVLHNAFIAGSSTKHAKAQDILDLYSKTFYI